MGSPASSSQLSTTRNTPTLAQPLISRSMNHASRLKISPCSSTVTAMSEAKLL
ncbi:hypothetical protein D3C85_1122840 [compost metagenome]